MATILNDPTRRIVPRWRLWRDAVRLGDVDASIDVRVPQEPNPDDLIRAKFDWESNRSLPFAGDFLGKAYALGQGALASDAAWFVLKAESRTSKAARDLANLIVAEQTGSESDVSEPLLRSVEDRRQRVRTLRTSLREFLRNPLAYMDLAREYVALGQPLAALRPVQIALALAPDSRFVLRSASRFFLHFNDPKQAHNVLRRAERVKADPWLLAAEIAVASAAGRTSSLVNIGRRFIDSQKFSPSHVSELASALGTLEWEAGKIKPVKRLFRHSLEKPTENAVAQAGWISRRLGGLELNQRALDTPRSYEARAWSNIIEGNWSNSLSSAELWLRDEPFAKRPAVLGSWVALTTATDLTAAERLARNGLMMHPEEFFLLNNLAVSLAYLGRASEASEIFQRIAQKDAEGPYKATYLATKGLIRFRLGSAEEGRQLYHMAVNEAKHRRDAISVVSARLHFAREEFRCAPKTAEKLVEEARGDFKKLSKLEQTITTRMLDLILHEHRRQFIR